MVALLKIITSSRNWAYNPRLMPARFSLLVVDLQLVRVFDGPCSMLKNPGSWWEERSTYYYSTTYMGGTGW